MKWNVGAGGRAGISLVSCLRRLIIGYASLPRRDIEGNVILFHHAARRIPDIVTSSLEKKGIPHIFVFASASHYCLCGLLGRGTTVLGWLLLWAGWDAHFLKNNRIGDTLPTCARNGPPWFHCTAIKVETTINRYQTAHSSPKKLEK